jgi:imidazolonepropionase-like amidohydrolase
MEMHSLPQYLITPALITLPVVGCSTSSPTLTPTNKPTSTPTTMLTATLSPSAQEAEATPLALINGTLVDGTGAEPVLDATIVIWDGRISEVGPSEKVALPPDAQVIDVRGGTILPGFINAHVHLAFETENLATWAQAGITTVRDVGASTLSPLMWDEWIQITLEGKDLPRSKLFDDRDTILNLPQYARIVAAGPIMTVPGGYPIPIHGNHLALSVTSPEDALQKMSKLLDAGADVIKIALESRWGLQQARLSKEEVEAIVAVAHQRAAIVTAHVGLAQDLALGIEAGIDDAAHMVNDHLPDELIAQMIAKDVYIVPTLAVKEAYGWPDATVENVRRFVMAGGKVALGDDYGNPGIELRMPIRDMELMEEAGMTPMQIIVAGTKHSAHVCNLEEELGTLEVGKIADVLVVDGDPLRDIHALTNVWLVIKDGVVIRSPES